jgi:hypothetical protein
MAQVRPNRRHYPRVQIRFPVRVKGYDASGVAWDEITTSEDASAGGVAFRLIHAVDRSQVLYLMMAMPAHLRRYDEDQAGYAIYSLVRNVLAGQSAFWVRTKFLGRQPPRGYADSPGGRYYMPDEVPPARQERRRSPRYDVFLDIKLERLSVDDRRFERTVTENLGCGGARVPTSLPVAKGETIWVEEMGGDYRTQAVVRDIYVGNDKVARLNLNFRDPLPSRLINSDCR